MMDEEDWNEIRKWKAYIRKMKKEIYEKEE